MPRQARCQTPPYWPVSSSGLRMRGLSGRRFATAELAARARKRRRSMRADIRTLLSPLEVTAVYHGPVERPRKPAFTSLVAHRDPEHGFSFLMPEGWHKLDLESGGVIYVPSED